MSTQNSKFPLVEVVFELKLKSPSILDYEVFLGELYSSLKVKFPYKESLKPDGMPSMIMPFMVQHRFRKDRDSFPLYQLGPGILSFNTDGKTYEDSDKWVGFKKELTSFLCVYESVLSDKSSVDNFEYLSLRFINKFSDTNMYPDVKKYFSDTLQLCIDLNFAKDLAFIANLENTQLLQSYYLDKSKTSKFQLNLATITEGSRKIITDLSVVSTKMPSLSGISEWLEDSHSHIETFFEKLTLNIKHLFE